MKKHTGSVRLGTGTLIALALLTGSGDSPAEGTSKSAAVKQLLTQDLAGIPGKEAVMLTVEYPPGGSSLPHRHDADVFVYVLEGSLLMQVDGQPAVTLGPGQTFHESPTDIHRQSANASASQPAKFVVFIVKDKGKPATQPVK
jgi:quercetin dioxygenase-like cupin family protein